MLRMLEPSNTSEGERAKRVAIFTALEGAVQVIDPIASWGSL
jgi:hypothetical protein